MLFRLRMKNLKKIASDEYYKNRRQEKENYLIVKNFEHIGDIDNGEISKKNGQNG